MYLCLAAEKKPGMRLSRRWWAQPAPDYLEIRVGNEKMEGGGREIENLGERAIRVG